jgi:hypothetical protein
MTIEHNEGSNTYKAFNITQALAAAPNFAVDVGNVSIDGKVNVYFPVDGVVNIIANIIANFVDEDSDILSALQDGAGTFCFNRILCLQDNNWNDYNTVTHEYSHFLEWRMNTYGHYTQIQFWKHFQWHTGLDDDILEYGKEFGMDLAWSEGWGYAFSALALQYSGYLHALPVVNNYLTGVGWGTFAKYTTNYSVDYDSGEAQEDNIAALLIDLYCPYPGKSSPLTLGYSEFFRTSAKSGISTMSDFAQNLDAEYTSVELRNAIGERLGTIKSRR